METRIIKAGEGEILGSLLGCRDRFLINSHEWGGGFALVEHLLAPRSIAAPMHRHANEDEFSFILEGRVWAQFEDTEHVAEVGDLMFKPRGEWHTFWNAADQPARLLELIAPGGLEQVFRIIGTSADEAEITAAVEASGCEGDMERTEAIIAKYGLTFG